MLLRVQRMVTPTQSPEERVRALTNDWHYGNHEPVAESDLKRLNDAIAQALRLAHQRGLLDGLKRSEAIAENHVFYGAPGNCRGLNVAARNIVADIAKAIFMLTPDVLHDK